MFDLCKTLRENLVELLDETRTYIEESERSMDAEYGDGRSVEQLVDQGQMPILYIKVNRMIEFLRESHDTTT